MSEQKTHSDSVQGEVSRAQGERYIMPVPKGQKLETDEELILWEQYTNCREASAWRELELLMLVRLVKIECHIRYLDGQIWEDGYYIINARGTQIANPMVAVQANYVRQQLSILSSLSLGVSSEKGVTLNATGKRKKDLDDSKEIREKGKKGKVVSLLAD